MSSVIVRDAHSCFTIGSDRRRVLGLRREIEHTHEVDTATGEFEPVGSGLQVWRRGGRQGPRSSEPVISLSPSLRLSVIVSDSSVPADTRPIETGTRT